MNKRGQFFLIAALAIIMIVIGLGVTNIALRSSSQEEVIFDLSDEIAYETTSVIDYGLIQNINSNSDSTKTIIQDLVTSYAQRNPSYDLIAVYGEKDSLNLIRYENKDLGEISINTGSPDDIELGDEIKRGVFSNKEISEEITGDITIKFENEDDIEQNKYEFKIKENNQHFYLILKQEGENEKIIASNTR